MFRVYVYSLRAPTGGTEAMMAQIQAGHRYGNKLVEIERERRAKIRASLESEVQVAQLAQQVKQADETLTQAIKALKAEKSRTGKASGSEDAKLRVKAARSAKFELSAQLRKARSESRARQAVACDLINNEAAAQRRAARAASGPSGEGPMYWGSYLRVESARQDSAQKLPLYDDDAQPNDPKFIRWDGRGVLGVQIQHGMSAESIFRGNAYIQVDPVSERAWYPRKCPRPLQREGQAHDLSAVVHSPPGQGRRTLMRTMLRMRIGSDEHKAPIWGTWPMMMHRPIPEGSVIKEAFVLKSKIGPRDVWKVYMCVDVPAPTCRNTLAVAVDIGYRQLADGRIRMAVWRGEDGAQGEFALSAPLVSSLRKEQDLISIRKKLFNASRDALVAWIKTGPELPDWFKMTTRTLADWKSPQRLAGLALRWSKNRFEGDALAFGQAALRDEHGVPIKATAVGVEGWRDNDLHLWKWEAHQRAKSRNRRREDFRLLAAHLADRYGVLVLEDFDLSAIARRPIAEKEKAENETARANRQLVAVGELRQTMVNTFAGRAATIKRMPPEFTTMRDHVCGHVDDFDAALSITHTCSKCGVTWDQDLNAAINLLQLYLAEKAGTPMVLGDPPKSRKRRIVKQNDPNETKWARARRMSAEKKARIDADQGAAVG